MLWVDAVTDANGNRTTYGYDGWIRKTQVNYPLPATAGTSSTTDYETFTLDNTGNVTTWRKRDGTSPTAAYDVLGRLCQRTNPDITNGLDGSDKLTHPGRSKPLPDPD